MLGVLYKKRELAVTVEAVSLAWMLGLHDVLQRYKRSSLGAFWLTISTGVLIATLGFVFGTVFGAPMREFLPFLACGLILWSYINTSVIEGCMCFIDADAMIKQIPLPLSVHVLRVLFRNIIILAHNILIIPIMFIILKKPITLNIIFLIPGFFMVSAALLSLMFILGLICTRFRDVAQIVQSIFQILFYVTPIIWMPNLVSELSGKFVLIEVNPVFHIIEIVRAPLLGAAPNLLNWLAVAGILFVLFLVKNFLFKRYHKRIPMWL